MAGVLAGLAVVAVVAVGVLATSGDDDPTPDPIDQDVVVDVTAPGVGPTATSIATADPTPSTDGSADPRQTDPQAAEPSPPAGTPTGPSATAPPATANPAPTDVEILSGHPDAGAIAATLQAWHDGINTADYAAAFDTYTPALQQQVTLERFRNGNQTSTILAPSIRSVHDGQAARIAVITFRSLQDPQFGPRGQACSDWILEWTMRFGEDRWLVDAVQALEGSPTGC